jgi:hypothetical protein
MPLQVPLTSRDMISIDNIMGICEYTIYRMPIQPILYLWGDQYDLYNRAGGIRLHDLLYRQGE